jgi:hypothetical protein
MFRAEQGCQSHARCPEQDVDRTGAAGAAAGVIGDQADPLVLQNVKVLVGKDIDTGQDSRVGAEWFEQKQQSDNKRPE